MTDSSAKNVLHIYIHHETDMHCVYLKEFLKTEDLFVLSKFIICYYVSLEFCYFLHDYYFDLFKDPCQKRSCGEYGKCVIGKDKKPMCQCYTDLQLNQTDSKKLQFEGYFT